MATNNVTVTRSWTLVSTVSSVITPNYKKFSVIEFATALNMPNSIIGTPLKNGQSAAISLGSNEKIYARSVGPDDIVTLVIERIV